MLQIKKQCLLSLNLPPIPFYNSESREGKRKGKRGDSTPRERQRERFRERKIIFFCQFCIFFAHHNKDLV